MAKFARYIKFFNNFEDKQRHTKCEVDTVVCKECLVYYYERLEMVSICADIKILKKYTYSSVLKTCDKCLLGFHGSSSSTKNKRKEYIYNYNDVRSNDDE